MADRMRQRFCSSPVAHGLLDLSLSDERFEASAALLGVVVASAPVAAISEVTWSRQLLRWVVRVRYREGERGRLFEFYTRRGAEWLAAFDALGVATHESDVWW